VIFLQHFVLQSSADPMADMADAEQTLAATQPEAGVQLGHACRVQLVALDEPK